MLTGAASATPAMHIAVEVFQLLHLPRKMHRSHLRPYPRVTCAPTSTCSRGKCDPEGGRGTADPRARLRRKEKNPNGGKETQKLSYSCIQRSRHIEVLLHTSFYIQKL